MAEITKTENQKPRTENRIIWFFFVLAAIFVYFFALGSIPLLGPDEPRYAEVAREMFLRGDWVTPTLGGFDWFEKPALLYWLEIVSYHIFGISEFAARFGSAICGLGTIFCLWILGRNLTTKDAKHAEKNRKSKTENQKPKTDFADWLFLISASSVGILTFSRAASFDIILTFPITASLVGFFIFDQSNKKSITKYYLPLAAFYFFIGVALLAKGLVGAVFPLAIVAFYFILSRKLPNKTFVFSLVWGAILSLAVAAVWYLPMYLVNGWKFVDEFFVQQQFQRYTSNKYLHPQPFWFFWVILPLLTLPWLPFFVASILDFLKVQSSKFKVQNPKSENQKTKNSALLLFSISWLLVPLVFFSFSGSKLPGYILPSLPAALILTAEYVARFVGESRRRKLIVQTIAWLTFAAVIIILQFFVVSYARSETIKPLIETARNDGYNDEKVLNFNTISHSAEFYAADRLIRAADGKQRRFFTAAEIAEEMRRENLSNVLVLAPLQFVSQLTESDALEAQVLGDNTELAIVAVKVK